MKNTEMKRIAADMIAEANLPEDLTINICKAAGNKIGLTTTVRHLVNRTYNITKGAVTRTVTDTHYEYYQRGYGVTLWGIQGKARFRQAVGDYIESVRGC